MQTITIEEAINNPAYILIDLRSPSEFHEATIPGAINVPLFDDEERARVGTIYKRENPAAARKLGLSIASAKLPNLVDTIERVSRGKKVVVFCWRGGMRSRSLGVILDLMQIPVYQLAGGYKAYRKWVVEHLTPELLPEFLVVVHGLTGVGKTELLQALLQEGLPVIDLEKHANHRGSVFGGLGLGEPRSQKMFESLLLHDLQRYLHSRYIIVEAESRRIGNVLLPDFFKEAMVNSPYHVLTEGSMEKRVDRLLAEYYRGDVGREHLQESLQALKKWMSREQYGMMEELLRREDYRGLAEQLLRNYYDPLYEHSQKKVPHYSLTVNTDDMPLAVREVIQYLIHTFSGGERG